MASFDRFGLNKHRLTRDNPLERRFSKYWHLKPKGKQTRYWEDVLPYILSSDPQYPCTVSDHDAIVAATVIQWLGTNVGRQFLSEVLEVNISRDGTTNGHGF